MNLTLAIPVHNDQADLCRLLMRARQLAHLTHVVVVDDGSDIPVTSDMLRAASGLPPHRLTLLRHDSALGPGAARNHALAHAPGDHLLFLDADDLPTPELSHLLHDLDGQDFDFCLFQHHDTRMEREHSWGQPAHDQTLWQAAGVEAGALCPVSPEAAAHLAGTANYPWNKIYRTAFLRAGRIGCSPIMVHEDIELHWRSFLMAERILVSDRIGVIHVIHEAGARLTNRTGAERLDVFGPLERIADEIGSDKSKNRLYSKPFFVFTLSLFDWIVGNLHPEYQARFADLVQDFLRDHVPPALLEDTARTRLALMARLRPGPTKTQPRPDQA